MSRLGSSLNLARDRPANRTKAAENETKQRQHATKEADDEQWRDRQKDLFRE
jgi:hypothetical protein